MYDRLITRLTNRDHAVLSLKFHDQILTYDARQVLASFEHASSKSAEVLHKLANGGRYRNISMFAVSLGTPILTMTAIKFTHFCSVTMITPATNLATSVWYGSHTRRIREAFEKRGNTLRDIDTLWQPIAPVNNIYALQDKKVNIIISKVDKIVPAQYQADYVSALVAQGINPDVHQSRLGHYATIGRHCLFGNIDDI